MKWGSFLRPAHTARWAVGERAACAILAAAALAPLPLAAQATGSTVAEAPILDPIVLAPGQTSTSARSPSRAIPAPADPAERRADLCDDGRTGPRRRLPRGAVRRRRHLPVPAASDQTGRQPDHADRPDGRDDAGDQPDLRHDHRRVEFLGLAGNRHALSDPDRKRNFTLHVGGTLNVAATQRPGVYTGTFALEFNYD